MEHRFMFVGMRWITAQRWRLAARTSIPRRLTIAQVLGTPTNSQNRAESAGRLQHSVRRSLMQSVRFLALARSAGIWSLRLRSLTSDRPLVYFRHTATFASATYMSRGI